MLQLVKAFLLSRDKLDHYIAKYNQQFKTNYNSGDQFYAYYRDIADRVKKKQIDIFKPEDLGVDVTPRIKTLKVSEPPKRSAGIKVADVAALIDKLKNEAKVI